MKLLADTAPDLSDRIDGPAVFAFWGEDKPASAFRLGSREYDYHCHPRGQLFCVESGLVHVRTARGSWLLPPHQAGWIPPGESHKVSISGAMSGWGLFVAPEASRVLPSQPCVLGISELMKALVRRATSWGLSDHRSPEQERLTMVLLDELRHTPHEPLHLPMPTDRRLLRIAAALLDEPHDSRTLEAWAAWAGLSASTLGRLFRAETGTSFAQWRQQARLTHALELLAQGQAVGTVADALGYATPSNFIVMFKRCFGASPARYFADRKSV